MPSQDDFPDGEPVELPITDVLDLHSFHVRIIHGRGVGVQRQTVRKVLERDPRVAVFEDAPATAGGWGATSVTFHRSDQG
jgi:dsDNA-specific endonuclease/ATPase MutS2